MLSSVLAEDLDREIERLLFLDPNPGHEAPCSSLPLSSILCRGFGVSILAGICCFVFLKLFPMGWLYSYNADHWKMKQIKKQKRGSKTEKRRSVLGYLVTFYCKWFRIVTRALAIVTLFSFWKTSSQTKVRGNSSAGEGIAHRPPTNQHETVTGHRERGQNMTFKVPGAGSPIKRKRTTLRAFGSAKGGWAICHCSWTLTCEKVEKRLPRSRSEILPRTVRTYRSRIPLPPRGAFEMSRMLDKELSSSTCRGSLEHSVCKTFAQICLLKQASPRQDLRTRPSPVTLISPPQVARQDSSPKHWLKSKEKTTPQHKVQQRGRQPVRSGFSKSRPQKIQISQVDATSRKECPVSAKETVLHGSSASLCLVPEDNSMIKRKEKKHGDTLVRKAMHNTQKTDVNKRSSPYKLPGVHKKASPNKEPDVKKKPSQCKQPLPPTGQTAAMSVRKSQSAKAPRQLKATVMQQECMQEVCQPREKPPSSARKDSKSPLKVKKRKQVRIKDLSPFASGTAIKNVTRKKQSVSPKSSPKSCTKTQASESSEHPCSTKPLAGSVIRGILRHSKKVGSIVSQKTLSGKGKVKRTNTPCKSDWSTGPEKDDAKQAKQQSVGSFPAMDIRPQKETLQLESKTSLVKGSRSPAPKQSREESIHMVESLLSMADLQVPSEQSILVAAESPVPHSLLMPTAASTHLSEYTQAASYRSQNSFLFPIVPPVYTKIITTGHKNLKVLSPCPEIIEFQKSPEHVTLTHADGPPTPIKWSRVYRTLKSVAHGGETSSSNFVSSDSFFSPIRKSRPRKRSYTCPYSAVSSRKLITKGNPIENTLLLRNSGITATCEDLSSPSLQGPGSVTSCKKWSNAQKFPTLSSFLSRLEKEESKRRKEIATCLDMVETEKRQTSAHLKTEYQSAMDEQSALLEMEDQKRRQDGSACTEIEKQKLRQEKPTPQEMENNERKQEKSSNLEMEVHNRKQEKSPRQETAESKRKQEKWIQLEVQDHDRITEKSACLQVAVQRDMQKSPSLRSQKQSPILSGRLKSEKEKQHVKSIKSPSPRMKQADMKKSPSPKSGSSVQDEHTPLKGTTAKHPHFGLQDLDFYLEGRSSSDNNEEVSGKKIFKRKVIAKIPKKKERTPSPTTPKSRSQSPSTRDKSVPTPTKKQTTPSRASKNLRRWDKNALMNMKKNLADKVAKRKAGKTCFTQEKPGTLTETADTIVVQDKICTQNKTPQSDVKSQSPVSLLKEEHSPYQTSPVSNNVDTVVPPSPQDEIISEDTCEREPELHQDTEQFHPKPTPRLLYQTVKQRSLPVSFPMYEVAEVPYLPQAEKEQHTDDKHMNAKHLQDKQDQKVIHSRKRSSLSKDAICASRRTSADKIPTSADQGSASTKGKIKDESQLLTTDKVSTCKLRTKSSASYKGVDLHREDVNKTKASTGEETEFPPSETKLPATSKSGSELFDPSQRQETSLSEENVQNSDTSVASPQPLTTEHISVTDNTMKINEKPLSARTASKASVQMRSSVQSKDCRLASTQDNTKSDSIVSISPLTEMPVSLSQGVGKTLPTLKVKHNAPGVKKKARIPSFRCKSVATTPKGKGKSTIESPSTLSSPKKSSSKSYLVHTVERSQESSRNDVPRSSSSPKRVLGLKHKAIKARADTPLDSDDVGCSEPKSKVRKSTMFSYTSMYRTKDATQFKATWRETAAFRKRLQFILDNNKDSQKKTKLGRSRNTNDKYSRRSTTNAREDEEEENGLMASPKLRFQVEKWSSKLQSAKTKRDKRGSLFGSKSRQKIQGSRGDRLQTTDGHKEASEYIYSTCTLSQKTKGKKGTLTTKVAHHTYAKISKQKNSNIQRSSVAGNQDALSLLPSKYNKVEVAKMSRSPLTAPGQRSKYAAAISSPTGNTKSPKITSTRLQGKIQKAARLLLRRSMSNPKMGFGHVPVSEPHSCRSDSSLSSNHLSMGTLIKHLEKRSVSVRSNKSEMLESAMKEDPDKAVLRTRKALLSDQVSFSISDRDADGQQVDAVASRHREEPVLKDAYPHKVAKTGVGPASANLRVRRVENNLQNLLKKIGRRRIYDSNSAPGQLLSLRAEAEAAVTTPQNSLRTAFSTQEARWPSPEARYVTGDSYDKIIATSGTHSSADATISDRSVILSNIRRLSDRRQRDNRRPQQLTVHTEQAVLATGVRRELPRLIQQQQVKVSPGSTNTISEPHEHDLRFSRSARANHSDHSIVEQGKPQGDVWPLTASSRDASLGSRITTFSTQGASTSETLQTTINRPIIALNTNVLHPQARLSASRGIEMAAQLQADSQTTSEAQENFTCDTQDATISSQELKTQSSCQVVFATSSAQMADAPLSAQIPESSVILCREQNIADIVKKEQLRQLTKPEITKPDEVYGNTVCTEVYTPQYELSTVSASQSTHNLLEDTKHSLSVSQSVYDLLDPRCNARSEVVSSFDTSLRQLETGAFEFSRDRENVYESTENETAPPESTDNIWDIASCEAVNSNTVRQKFVDRLNKIKARGKLCHSESTDSLLTNTDVLIHTDALSHTDPSSENRLTAQTSLTSDSMATAVLHKQMPVPGASQIIPEGGLPQSQVSDSATGKYSCTTWTTQNTSMNSMIPRDHVIKGRHRDKTPRKSGTRKTDGSDIGHTGLPSVSPVHEGQITVSSWIDTVPASENEDNNFVHVDGSLVAVSVTHEPEENRRKMSESGLPTAACGRAEAITSGHGVDEFGACGRFGKSSPIAVPAGETDGRKSIDVFWTTEEPVDDGNNAEVNDNDSESDEVTQEENKIKYSDITCSSVRAALEEQQSLVAELAKKEFSGKHMRHRRVLETTNERHPVVRHDPAVKIQGIRSVATCDGDPKMKNDDFGWKCVVQERTADKCQRPQGTSTENVTHEQHAVTLYSSEMATVASVDSLVSGEDSISVKHTTDVVNESLQKHFTHGHGKVRQKCVLPVLAEGDNISKTDNKHGDLPKEWISGQMEVVHDKGGDYTSCYSSDNQFPTSVRRSREQGQSRKDKLVSITVKEGESARQKAEQENQRLTKERNENISPRASTTNVNMSQPESRQGQCDVGATDSQAGMEDLEAILNSELRVFQSLSGGKQRSKPTFLRQAKRSVRCKNSGTSTKSTDSEKLSGHHTGEKESVSKQALSMPPRPLDHSVIGRGQLGQKSPLMSGQFTKLSDFLQKSAPPGGPYNTLDIAARQSKASSVTSVTHSSHDGGRHQQFSEDSTSQSITTRRQNEINKYSAPPIANVTGASSISSLGSDMMISQHGNEPSQLDVADKDGEKEDDVNYWSSQDKTFLSGRQTKLEVRNEDFPMNMNFDKRLTDTGDSVKQNFVDHIEGRIIMHTDSVMRPAHDSEEGGQYVYDGAEQRPHRTRERRNSDGSTEDVIKDISLDSSLKISEIAVKDTSKGNVHCSRSVHDFSKPDSEHSGGDRTQMEVEDHTLSSSSSSIVLSWIGSDTLDTDTLLVPTSPGASGHGSCQEVTVDVLTKINTSTNKAFTTDTSHTESSGCMWGDDVNRSGFSQMYYEEDAGEERGNVSSRGLHPLRDTELPDRTWRQTESDQRWGYPEFARRHRAITYSVNDDQHRSDAGGNSSYYPQSLLMSTEESEGIESSDHREEIVWRAQDPNERDSMGNFADSQMLGSYMGEGRPLEQQAYFDAILRDPQWNPRTGEMVRLDPDDMSSDRAHGLGNYVHSAWLYQNVRYRISPDPTMQHEWKQSKVCFTKLSHSSTQLRKHEWSPTYLSVSTDGGKVRFPSPDRSDRDHDGWGRTDVLHYDGETQNFGARRISSRSTQRGMKEREDDSTVSRKEVMNTDYDHPTTVSPQLTDNAKGRASCSKPGKLSLDQHLRSLSGRDTHEDKTNLTLTQHLTKASASGKQTSSRSDISQQNNKDSSRSPSSQASFNWYKPNSLSSPPSLSTQYEQSESPNHYVRSPSHHAHYEDAPGVGAATSSDPRDVKTKRAVSLSNAHLGSTSSTASDTRRPPFPHSGIGETANTGQRSNRPQPGPQAALNLPGSQISAQHTISMAMQDTGALPAIHLPHGTSGQGHQRADSDQPFLKQTSNDTSHRRSTRSRRRCATVGTPAFEDTGRERSQAPGVALRLSERNYAQSDHGSTYGRPHGEPRTGESREGSTVSHSSMPVSSRVSKIVEMFERIKDK